MKTLVLTVLLALVPVQQLPRSLSDIAADLHRLELELLNRPVPSTTFTVADADSFVSAIVSSKGGDTIVLQPGVRYVAALQLPAKSGGVVTIRSSASLPERRITPADAALLPILASGDNGPVVDGTNATNWSFVGLQFESTQNGAGEALVFENAENIFLDRVLLVAGVNGQKRGIRGNARNITLTRSYIANIWAYGQDTQAFEAWDGAGPYTITDNYLEAAGENVMFGGSDGGTPQSIPSDILIDGNTFSKRLEWRGQGKAVKNLFELKVGKRVVVRNNLFEHNWTDAQNGYGILIKAINQDGGNPWNVTEDVLFENNILRDSENGINVLGYDYLQPSGRVTRLTIRGNVIQTIGVALQFGGEVGDVIIDHNTFLNGYTFMSLYGGGVWPTGEPHIRDGVYAIQHLTFTGNLGNHNDYGVKGDNSGIGTAALLSWVPSYDWQNNVLLGGAGRTYPPTTYFDLASVPVGILVGKQ